MSNLGKAENYHGDNAAQCKPTGVVAAVGLSPETQSPAPIEAPLDPFDPAVLRLDPNTASGAIGVRRRVLSIKVDKPNKQEFVRIHPDESFRLTTAIIEDKLNREAYLVASELWPELSNFIIPVRLCAAVTRHGTPFLWPAKLPDKDRPMAWHESMLAAQDIAARAWVRVQADMSAGNYAVFEATGKLPDPEWPELSFPEMLRLAFKSHYVDSMHHPYVQVLLGNA